MNAVAVAPDTGPVPRLIDIPEPSCSAGDALVEGLLVGICGTDRDVVARAASLSGEFVLGHESLGRVVEAPADSGLASGDLVVGLIRRPCPEACAFCRRGELDRCATRPPVERGISRADGFAAELWTSSPAFLCPVPPELDELGILIEPASSVIKGLRRLGEHRRANPPRNGLVFGAGTIGLLAAAAMAHAGIDVDVSDPLAPGRAAIAEALGARLVAGSPAPRAYDVVVEASGESAALERCFDTVGPSGSIVVLGVPAVRSIAIAGAARLVMDDVDVTFSVNATFDDHLRAAALLCEIEQSALGRMVGRELPLACYAEALTPDAGSPKTVVRVTAA